MYPGFAFTCGYIRPPPRGDSRFLFEFPFGLPELRAVLSLALCARVVVASTILCPYLIYAYCVSRLYAYVYARAYAYVHTCERYNPPLVPLLNFTPSFASTHVRTCNGRVACHSIAHACWEPTHTHARTHACMYTGARVLRASTLSPRAADSR